MQQTEMSMITRQEYLSNSRELFHEYYSQFVTKESINLVKDTFGTDKLIKAYQKDKSLNTIPLHEWDRIFIDKSINVTQFKKVNESFYTLSDRVCLAKNAAKQIIFEKLPSLRNYYKES